MKSCFLASSLLASSFLPSSVACPPRPDTLRPDAVERELLVRFTCPLPSSCCFALSLLDVVGRELDFLFGESALTSFVGLSAGFSRSFPFPLFVVFARDARRFDWLPATLSASVAYGLPGIGASGWPFS